jgi:aminopeptidase YwaD
LSGDLESAPRAQRFVTHERSVCWLWLTLLLASAGCGGVSRRPEVVARVEQVEPSRLLEHVSALTRIGPRPAEDLGATASTIAWLQKTLTGLGYAVQIESVNWQPPGGRLVARVRPQDSDDDTPYADREIPVALMHYGARPIQSYSRKLRAEGWEVDGYAMLPSSAANPARDVPNLIVEIQGNQTPGEVVELSAHYDSVAGSPGADDNASGVAALLEVARVLADARPERTLRFCFFSLEEAGLLGSAAHVKRFAVAGAPEVVALLNLDSVGFATRQPDSQQAPVRIPLVTWMPSTGDFLTVIGNWDSGALGNLFEACIDTYAPELPYYSANRIGAQFDDGWRSDHAHYWRAGIPALFLTDTGEFRTDTYHRPDDTLETVDMAFLADVTRATVAAALELANR